MNDWAGGYVSDIEYVAGFYREQAPAHLDLTAILCGVEPARRPGTTTPFTYCEIGCGHGSTVTALAAANPEGTFTAIDFNPAHIARAEDFRSRAELANLRFIEADIVALADDPAAGLPQFDYVTLHGVYSWVAPEVRRGIVRFLARYLRPGGLVLVSYNALPGRSSIVPAQRLIYEFASSLPGNSMTRVRAAVERLREVTQAGSAVLDPNTFEAVFGKAGGIGPSDERDTYLAHEFLNSSWEPIYHMDLARDLAEAKLEFVGSAAQIENFAGIGLSEKASAIVNNLPDGPFRETMKDYFNGRSFRRDVFVRGRRALAPDQREARLEEVMLALAGPVPDEAFEVRVLSSRVNLNRASYAPILESLKERPRAIRDLIGLARRDAPEITATEVAGMLSGMGAVLPVLRHVTSDSVNACRRHNETVARDYMHVTRQSTHTLAVPVGHSGKAVSALEIGMLDGLFRGLEASAEALSAHVLARSNVAPDEVRNAEAVGPAPAEKDDPNGEPNGDDPNLPMGVRVRAAVEECLAEALPHWRKLGLLEERSDG